MGLFAFSLAHAHSLTSNCIVIGRLIVWRCARARPRSFERFERPGCENTKAEPNTNSCIPGSGSGSG